MRWTPGGQSDDIDDLRDSGGPSAHMGIGGGRVSLLGLLILGLLSLVFKTDLISPFLTGSRGYSPVTTARRSNPDHNGAPDPAVQFVSFVLDDLQQTWAEVLPTEGGEPYRKARLVLFRNAIDSACGFAESATGPFYCPADGRVYLDLSFYDELKERFGASGDFAQAYVIAHEIGHHVQNLLGIEQKVRSLQRRRPEARNPLSVRMELQADCFAGIWGHSTAQRNILEQGDVEEALNAAAAIGDDRLQRMSTGRVAPESFTHGSSAQRVQWFKQGFTEGRLAACDTFSGDF